MINAENLEATSSEASTQPALATKNFNADDFIVAKAGQVVFSQRSAFWAVMQSMMPSTFDALVQTLLALRCLVVKLGGVGATMHQVVIKTDPLFARIHACEATKSIRNSCTKLVRRLFLLGFLLLLLARFG